MADNDTAIILEDIQSTLGTMAEAISLLAGEVHGIKQTVQVIPEMAADIKTIKAVQADQGREIRHIEKYLTTQGMPQRA